MRLFTTSTIFFLSCLCYLAPELAHAQLPGGGQAGLNAAMLELFGDIKAASAKADVQLKEKGSRDAISMTIDFDLLRPLMRIDLDINNLKGKQLPSATLAGFKAAGMDKVSTILRPEKESVLLLYPSVQSYVELPMSAEERADLKRKFQVRKTRLGSEKIGKYKCDKVKVVISSEQGQAQQALVWYARKLKSFPLRIQMDQEEMTVVMQFRDVKLTKPKAQRFVAPGRFTRFDTHEELTYNAMRKVFTGKQPAQQPKR
jgi:hypothetical protein